MVFEVEAIALRPVLDAEFVPKAAGDADPGTAAGLLNLLMNLAIVVGTHYVDDQLLILGVEAPLIRKDPGNFGFGGGGDKFALLIRRSGDTHGNDKDFLACEGLDEA